MASANRNWLQNVVKLNRFIFLYYNQLGYAVQDDQQSVETGFTVEDAEAFSALITKNSQGLYTQSMNTLL